MMELDFIQQDLIKGLKTVFFWQHHMCVYIIYILLDYHALNYFCTMRAVTFVTVTWVGFSFMMPLNTSHVIHRARSSNHRMTKQNTHEAAYYTLGIAPQVRGLNVSERLMLQSQLKRV